MNMSQNPRAQWWWLSSVETHIPNSLMVPCPLPLCIRSRAKKSGCVSCLSTPEMSLGLAGSLCGDSWEPWFLGWLGLLYSGNSATGSGSLWNGCWKYDKVSVYFLPMP